jgi:Tol biopolymer transport system component
MLIVLAGLPAFARAQRPSSDLNPKQRQLLEELRACPHRIVYESYRNGNWELMRMNAEGSDPRNLTNTRDADEVSPHASPDGTRILFIGSEGQGDFRADHVFLMNPEGEDRIKIIGGGREAFWSPDGKRIAYAKRTRRQLRTEPYGNDGLYFYDLATRKSIRHPRHDINHILTPCWSPDGNWIIASAIQGCAGFSHSIIAIQARGTGVVELRRSLVPPDNLYQCRPDISPDGKHVAWGRANTKLKDRMWIEVGDIDLSRKTPEVTNRRYIIEVPYPTETYHVDWSPCGNYIAYAQGPGRTSRMKPEPAVLTKKAPGWDIWVVRVSRPGVAVQLTHDGLSNKEPDWVPLIP